MNDDRIVALAERAWRLHQTAASAVPEIRVTPSSAPILYFGNRDAYRRSELRVITVGVNPSGEEFPTDAPWSRLACARVATADGMLTDRVNEYLAALNLYFDRDPYTDWFDRSYEPVLNGMGGSYYSGTSITALHTDVCSPVPTTPAWTQLEPHERAALAAEGVPLWHDLVVDLRPQVILASVSAAHFTRIALEPLCEPEVIYTVAHKRPYEVRIRDVRCGDQIATLLWAGASTTPFQPITHDHKRSVGAAVRRIIDGR